MRRVLLSALIAVVFMISTVSYAVESTTPPKAISKKSDRLSPEDVQRFSTAIGQIKKFYVEDVENSKLFDDAIRGMLQGLDPHSSYLDVNEFADLKSQTSGEFGGLGIEVTMEDDYIRVVSPIDDTPAYNAGIKPADLIIRINNKPVKGMSLTEAVKEMRGKKGTKINLTIYRKSEKQPLNFDLIRDIIKIKSVKSHILEPGYGYIRISHFQSPTAKNVIQAIDKLNKASSTPLKGIVLDLRNNPGGLLDSAISVSDTFIDSSTLKKNKLIVYTKGRIRGAQFAAEANPGDALKGIPIVVLINEGSASGSEIVAGALQDHHRAILMGTPTFGKGSVQTVLPLDKTRGVKLTTALYYTPKGRSIQAKGIKPDVFVEPMDVKMAKGSFDIAILKEADLGNHLENGNGQKNVSTNTTSNKKNTKKGKQPLAVKDYQLNEALILLKGLHIARQS